MRRTTLALITAAGLAASAAADIQRTQPPAARDDVQRAELLAARRSWPQAVAAYQAAIAARPQDAVLYNRLGICRQRGGETNAARAAYRRAIALDPLYAAAHNNLGTIEHARGRYKQAIAAYSKAIELRPEDAVFHRNLGSAWLARGDASRALEAWGEALRLDPAGFESDGASVPAGGVSLARQYYLFAKLLAGRGDVEKALEYLTRAHAAGFSEFAKVEADRDFASLVVDPRYAALK